MDVGSLVDNGRGDFGFPVTNWEVVVALTEIYNVTPNAAQNELLSAFTGERWADALTNNPGLTLNGFATGETPLDATGMPPTTETSVP